MERGFVKLWRKTLDNGVLQNGPAWQLFGYLLLTAAHRPVRYLAGNAVVVLQPGQAVVSRATAAKALHLSERQIRTALQLLEKLEILTSRATNRHTIISLTNWHRYNVERPAGDQPGDQQATSRRPAGDQQAAPVNSDTRIKEFKNNIYTASAPQQPSAAPPDGGAEHALPPAARKRPKDKATVRKPEGEYILTRKKRVLTGNDLVMFDRFWEAFAYKRGRAEAADAWLEIPQLTESLAACICDAARQEAAQRAQLESRGGMPKWAQGWLTGRRWEDYAPEALPMARARADPVPTELTPDEQEKARQTRQRLAAERRKREEAALTGERKPCAEWPKQTTTNAPL